MLGSLTRVVHKNLANAVSILGVLPLCLLLGEGGYQYLIPLIIYNNIMDDLDGILAAKLGIKSGFGGILDNVCDAVAHTLLVMVVGMRYGGVCGAISLVAVGALMLRVVSRLDPNAPVNTGSPTNELMRHMLFIILLAGNFGFNPAPFLTIAFAVHAVSMLVPYRMPYLLRSLTKSATMIGLVNVALVAAWRAPQATPIVAACFISTYLYSLAAGAYRRRHEAAPGRL